MLHGGSALVAEYGGSGAMLARYVHSVSGGDDPLIRYACNSTALADTRFLYADQRGSIVMEAEMYSGAPQGLVRLTWQLW